MSPSASFLASCVEEFRHQRTLAERAIAQLEPAQLHAVLHEDGNSIAVVMKHMAGNMVSRWTDFLTTDGEKPWRNRDGEFVDDFASRAQLDAHWERGWATLFATLESLSDADLDRTVTIRGEPHTVARALLRQVGHYGYHVGQIVAQARALRGRDWQSLSIPRGGSDAYNRRMGHA